MLASRWEFSGQFGGQFGQGLDARIALQIGNIYIYVQIMWHVPNFATSQPRHCLDLGK